MSYRISNAPLIDTNGICALRWVIALNGPGDAFACASPPFISHLAELIPGSRSAVSRAALQYSL